MSFGRRVALATVETDLSGVRLASALRRTAVVVAAMVGGRLLVSDQVGVSAGMAALLVGLLDKGPSPRAAWRTMGAATLLLAAVTLAAGLTSGNVVVSICLMAALAAAAGIGYYVNVRSTQTLLFAAVMAASYSVRPITPDTASEAALAVVVAGLLQAILTSISSPLIRDWPERRQVVAAAKATRRHLADVASHVDGIIAARLASLAVEQAERLLATSDLPQNQLDRYWLLLGDIDALRMEARALQSRDRLNVPSAEDARTRASLGQAADALLVAVRALLLRFSARRAECDALDAAAASLESWVSTAGRVSGPWAGDSVSRTVTDLARTVRDIVSKPADARGPRRPPSPLRARMRSAVASGSPGTRAGMRLAAAAIIGELVGLILGLSYSSWVAVTAMMVLRPDTGPTLPRIVMRALGATAGVGLVVVLMGLGTDSTQATMIMIALLVGAVFTFAAVNNAVMVGMMTALVISLLSLAGRDPQELAAARMLDVIVGCVIGTAFAVAVPIWTRDHMPESVRSYALASADYLAALAEQTHGDTSHARAAARRARSAGRAAETDLRVSLLEPGSRRINLGRLSVVIAWVQRANEAAVAAEAIGAHGTAFAPQAIKHARVAEQNLRAAAEMIAPTGSPPPLTELAEAEPTANHDEPDTADGCLRRAARCAAAARRAARPA